MHALANLFAKINRKSEKRSTERYQGSVREVSYEEIDNYLELEYFNAFRIALGIMFCIDSPVVAILVDGFDMGGLIPSGAAELFEGMSMVIFVAIAVCVYIYSAVRMSRWDFLKEEKCHIDDRTIRYIRMERLINRPIHTKIMILGILMIICSILPSMLFSKIGSPFIFMDNLSMASFLLMTSLGVFLLVMVCLRLIDYTFLLGLNDRNPNLPKEYVARDESIRYNNYIIEKGMSVFWPTVACCYISISFLTFAWGISWIIWPAAWIIEAIIGRIFRARA